MKTALRLLNIEDSSDDTELLCLELERGGFEVDWRRVDTAAGLEDALAEPWDLIVSDFLMPGFDGLQAFDIYKRHGLDTPFIFISGALGEERAVAAMRAGAADYFLKGKLARLNVAVRRELEQAKRRRDQRRAEQQLKDEQHRLAMAVQASGVGVFEHTVSPYRTFFSERCAEILGYRHEEMPDPDRVPVWFRGLVHKEDIDGVLAAHSALLAGERTSYRVNARVRHRQGHWVNVVVFCQVAADQEGPLKRVFGGILDVTEQHRLEGQLRQAQKMEAVGRLAGGVAHDFNNLLTAILSFGTFVLEELPAGSVPHQDMEEVLNAGNRAQILTGQLLAFSRKKTVDPRVLNINDAVAEIDRMLRRILGEDVELSLSLAAELWSVRVDPGALEQVIVNLAVNARDAMPGGGKLTLETANAYLGEDYAAPHGAAVPAGEYVVFSMSDEGVGMTEEVQRQLFEPFFTTKEPGTGTGLGLSTCYGIVKQADGFIWVYSEVGQGTTFKIYLPRVREKHEPEEERAEAPSPKGSETILLAEDDDQVRRLVVRILSREGYKVLEAANGKEALALCRSTTEPIHLLFTDTVMPGMGGHELMDQISELRPEVKVLYMSGYTEKAIVQRSILKPGVRLLEKPFSPDALAREVRAVLDA